eukprot:445901_1
MSHGMFKTLQKMCIIWILGITVFVMIIISFTLDINSSKQHQTHVNISRHPQINIRATQNEITWNSTPNIIWICWFQGWNNNTPLLQQLTFKSWKYYNQNDWIIILLDDSNIPLYINASKYLKYKQMHQNGAMGLAGLSDIVRIEILSTIGGVWVDASVFCTEPLNNWLTDYIQYNFFAFRQTDGTLLSTWFLFANKNSYLIHVWNDEIKSYWNTRIKMHKYRWVHFCFAKLYYSYTGNKTFAEKWDKVKYFSADIPHFIILQTWIAHKVKLSEEVKDHIDSHKAPMYKLSKPLYKQYKKVDNWSIIDYLVNTIPYETVSFNHVNKYKDYESVLDAFKILDNK